PGELRRPFREAGPAARRLLATDAHLRSEHAWLHHGADAAAGAVHDPHPPDSPDAPGTADAPAGHTGHAGPPGQQPPELLQPLTARERDVLGHLEELLTTAEIAERMFVSVNTVRTHIRGILRKLNVNRRNAAVRKARELGLLDD
ncbi:helix-turn-helix transcriptional regulator, partial [Saccharomonospora iraqiensis]|uniref:helix-turn-helix transcriptional regulator n=1 Tax=Saccharomonospora iraqiensis TaxID=52698 RepID=UPI00022E0AF2